MSKKVLVCLLSLVIVGCDHNPGSDVYTEVPRPDLYPGDMVTIKVSGEQAMIVHCRKKQTCSYRDRTFYYHTYWTVGCRVASLGQVQRDGLVSRDTTLDTYRIIYFQPYELNKAL